VFASRSLLKPALLGVLLGSGGAMSLWGQVPPAFTIRATLAEGTQDLVDNGTLTIPASGVGRTAGASLLITNRTTATVTVNFIQLTGAADFVVGSAPEAPFTLGPNGVFGVQLNYNAATSARVLGRFQFNYTSGNTSTNIGLNLVGIAPEFGYSFIPPGGNATVITNGGTIPFPATTVDTTSSATIIVFNRGTHTGAFNSATLTGADFSTIGVPLAGTLVEAGREIRFQVTYTPKTLDTSRGQLTVETADRRLQFALEGSGTGPRFAYETGPGSALRPNGTVTLADAPVGDKSSVVVLVRNTGNADGRITTISASGAGFNLTEVPLLPLTVTQNQAFAFTVNFQPTVPGRALGRLRIGNDDFDLAANALGSNLTYAFIANQLTTPVLTGGSVIFTPVAVGATSTLRFNITNTGTSPATISSIGLAAQSTIFTLAGLPNLPLTLAPEASAGFNIQFVPNALGASTATLRVDNQTFTLSGTGNAPPPLPDIQFDGATGAQQPLQQPAIGMLLSRAYPLALSGTLTLTFSSDVFTNDPSVQFATGGRTVTFTIPANSTRAVFPNSQNQIRVQTGSVAGTITVTPAITTTEGGIVLTPTQPPSANLTITSGAPQILSVAVGGKTANTITLLVSGYTTARSVTQMNLAFTPTTGENVRTQNLTLAVEGAFLGYYQGMTSIPFGSLFTASVPLTLAGDITGTSIPSIADTIQSVSVTLTNRIGVSQAVSVNTR